MADPTDTTHQVPGADVTTIHPGDRITLLKQPDGEIGLQVKTIRATLHNNVYISGTDLNPGGRPSVRAGRGVHLSGPAGGEWDWYQVRKPNRPKRVGRYRLNRVTGDGRAITRVARAHTASAEIMVAPDGRGTHMFQQPSLELTVQPDGDWTLRRWPASTDSVDRHHVVLAEGNVDGPPALIIGKDHVECPHCGARGQVSEVDSGQRTNTGDVTVVDGAITKAVWMTGSYGNAETVRHECSACYREVTAYLSGTRQDWR